MKPRTACFLLGVLSALALVTCFPARAQSVEIRRVLTDYGWHGVGGSVQVHQPTMEFGAPWVGIWERSPRGNRYGDWMYVKVLINCEQWQQIAFATLDADANMVLIADASGTDPVATWPEPGSEPYRTMTAVCALYGYQRQAVSQPPPLGNYVER